MAPSIKVVGKRVVLSAEGDNATLPLTDETRKQWQNWQERYRDYTARRQSGLLRVLGQDMFNWLDTQGWATRWKSAAGYRRLEIAADLPISDDQHLLLDLPWEVLADREGFLAQDSIQTFEVWRRVGPAADFLPTPRNADVLLLFAAASPRDANPVLDFEGEEAAILKSTEKLKSFSLFVDETGCPEDLRERTIGDEGFDAYHISCHGDLLTQQQAEQLADKGAEPGPNLLMETQTGEVTYVPPGRLATIWSGRIPQLVFLSACRTSERESGIQNAFTSELVRSVPAVIGWGASVGDDDATKFAANFYRNLAGAFATISAAAQARRVVLSESNEQSGAGAHWHLARLWLGPQGGGPIRSADGRHRHLPKNVGYKQFLDKKQRRKVAGPFQFVGRRRATQDGYRALRDDICLGLLILGMGNLGKSSLAARIANRFPALSPVVIVDNYDAMSIFTAICDELPPELRKSQVKQWSDYIAKNPTELSLAIEALLTGPLAEKPILLIIDDFEDVLNDPKPGEEYCSLKTTDGYDKSIKAVFASFKKARGASRLLLTSRYDFSAMSSNANDFAEEFEKLQLGPLTLQDREKQWRAEQNLRLLVEDQVVQTAVERSIEDPSHVALREAIIEIADGNPGLQDLFASPLMSGEYEVVRAAIRDLRVFLDEPAKRPQEQNAAFEFIRHMTFEKYKNALTKTEATTLKASTVFGEGAWPETIQAVALAALDRYQRLAVPVPAEALDTVGKAAGVSAPEKARRRLLGLGLLDPYEPREQAAGDPEYLVNRFARPLVDKLTNEDRAHLATAAVPVLEKLWAKGNNSWPRDERSVEALRLHLLADDSS